MNRDQVVAELRKIALEAGDITLKYFNANPEVEEKGDGSPVTIADKEAEDFITARLKELTPDIPVVGEEAVSENNIPDISGGIFWLVDPLDGTKEFISGRGEYTVNIGLIENGVPTMGVVYVPWVREMYAASEPGKAFMSLDGGADRQIHMRAVPPEGLTVISSRRHGDQEKLDKYLADEKVANQISRSSSLKFCALARGDADIYPRFGPTCEWDTAAGDAVLRAAGGMVTDVDGNPFVYGKSDVKFLNPEFIARAAPESADGGRLLQNGTT